MQIQRILLALVITGLLSPSFVAAQQKGLRVVFTKSAIPVDPNWGGWKAAPAIEVPLIPQVIAQPWNLDPAVKQLKIKAVHNGNWIAFLLTWKDSERNSLMRADTFRDAVAAMVPVGKAAAITMGAPKERVLMLHWKADWQEDIDKGFQDVAELYPNAWTDWYPFVVGEPPYEITAWTNPEAQRYMTGWVVGNPLSQPTKRTAVEEQIAEGAGTVTTSPRQSAVGKGIYANGEWNVAIARPFITGDLNDPQWGPGKETTVAFAVWDGGKGEIGSRKGYSNWVPVTIHQIGR